MSRLYEKNFLVVSEVRATPTRSGLELITVPAAQLNDEQARELGALVLRWANRHGELCRCVENDGLAEVPLAWCARCGRPLR